MRRPAWITGMARRWRGQRGMTAAELVVAVSLFGAVVAIFGPVMTSSMRTGRVISNESRAIDEVRIAVGRIDRELRSACSVSAPALGASGSVLTFETQAGTGGPYEVSYQITGGQLQRTANGVTEYVGEGLVVTSQEFTRTQSNVQSREEIAIDLQVQFEDRNSPRSIKTTIAGRNTWAGCV